MAAGSQRQAPLRIELSRDSMAGMDAGVNLTGVIMMKTIPMLALAAAAAALTGCMTVPGYGYQDGYGDYYYGQPSVDYDYYGYPYRNSRYGYGPYRYSRYGYGSGWSVRYGYPSGYGYGYSPYYRYAPNYYYSRYYSYYPPYRDHDDDRDHDDAGHVDPDANYHYATPVWRDLDAAGPRRVMNEPRRIRVDTTPRRISQPQTSRNDSVRQPVRRASQPTQRQSGISSRARTIERALRERDRKEP